MLYRRLLCNDMHAMKTYDIPSFQLALHFGKARSPRLSWWRRWRWYLPWMVVALTLLPRPALAVESLTFHALPGWYGGSGIVGTPTGLQNGGGLDNLYGVEFNATVLYFQTGPILEAPLAPPFPFGPDGHYLSDIPDLTYRWDGGGAFAIETGFRWCLTCNGGVVPFVSGDVTGASLVVTNYNADWGSWEGTFVLDLLIEDARNPEWHGAATLTMPIHPTSTLMLGGGGGLQSSPEVAMLTLVPTPEPATWLLLGSGLVAVGWWRRR